MKKYKTKYKFLSLIGLFTLSAGLLVGCGPSSDPTTGPTTDPTEDPTTDPTTSEPTTAPDPVGPNLDFSYYQTTKFNSDNKIQIINQTTDNVDRVYTAQAIQGLFARKEVTYYVAPGYVTNGVNVDLYYIEQASKNYNFTYETVSFEEAIQNYIANWKTNVDEGIWGSKIDLNSFNNRVGITAYTETTGEGYSTPGYIVYRPGNFSVNTAATLAGITGFLPVSKDDVEFYQGLGLKEKFNLDNAALSYKWLFDLTISELSTKGLIHQNYDDSTGKTNHFIKDYGIANKYFHVYYDEVSSVSNSFKKNLHSFLDANSPIFGYAYSEDSDVAFFSQYGQFLVPTDYTCNLTFHAADIFAGKTYTQPNNDRNLPAEDGKHYVAFVVSDGDNATYWANTAGFATNYMNASGREKDTFPVTWSITPSLVDLMPVVLDSVYGEMSNGYDYFCAPVSGQGYINAGQFSVQNDGEFFDDFCEKLDIYMTKADLQTVTVIGADSASTVPEVLSGYASADAVKGGLVYMGGKYFTGVKGGVMWVNGKPFVGPRDSLWQTTPAYIAARLNTYGTDITTVDAYSIINVHPWSHSYEDIRTIVSMLNDNIEVCSVDRIINMMTDNITDKSNTTSFNIPEKNGVSITESYLQDNPNLIPVDPLYNDFLLWEEDWTGSGLTYNSNDYACSNVGAMYAGNISIAKGTTASKNEFTLPEIDNYWLSFNVRGDSNSETHNAYFKATLTIDGVTKEVINEAKVLGVRGTESQFVYGDGYQCFAVPLAQYFPDYKGKTCTFSIEVLDKGTHGIRLDQVAFKERYVDPAIDLSNVDVYNNEFNDSTEDWLLGEQYKTSQYYWWSTIDRESLLPTGTIQIDCSDGGGDEKRNGNTNMWMAKNYVLPESGDITLDYKVSCDEPTGAKLKISMYVGGKYYVLTDWTVARNETNNTNYSINLNELDPSMNFNGLEATIIFEARDGGTNNGVGEACRLFHFKTLTE